MGFGKDGKGVIITEQRSQALTTLAAGAALFVGTKLAMTDDFRMLKTELEALLIGGTAGDVEGLVIGLIDADLSPAEVAAAILANGPLDANDSVTADLAMRPVWLIGALETNFDGTAGRFKGRQGNSPMMEHNPKWTFSAAKGWQFFIFNDTGSALTTGSTVQILAKNFGVWVR